MSFNSIFTDTFTRADSTTIGNGWVEDNASSFAIVSNTLVGTGGGNFYDNIIRAPSSANFQDGKVVVEWTQTSGSLPQLYLRLNQTTSNGYLAYLNGTTFNLSKLVTSSLTTLSSARVPITIGNDYRFTFDISGNAKTAVLYDITGSSTLSTLSNSTDTAFTASGYVGVSVYNTATVTYDNFESFEEVVANGTITTSPIKNYSGTIQANGSGWIANVYNLSTGALVVRKTGQTTSASGVMTIVDASIVASTSYRVDIDDGSTLFGNKEYTAT